MVQLSVLRMCLRKLLLSEWADGRYVPEADMRVDVANVCLEPKFAVRVLSSIGYP